MSDFEISRMQDGVGLKLVGELDLATTPELTKALLDAALSYSPVRLDLSELTFLDSCGIHAILTHARSQNGHGPLVLLNPSTQVSRILDILGLDEHAGIEVRQEA
jgi:anti-sigma B factor antagonist